ncbi:MAG TPA: cysteine hydrolase family protein [Thermoanaerobaculia bacterium]|jgi:nicotinamidase-related amidase|nr:cysteine hydrolase family protein [Thermoanaerobaculia bacterium]
MSQAPVPIERSALLVVDIQDSFKAIPSRWEQRSNPRFEENVDRLIQAWRGAGLPVIFVLHTDPDPGFETTSPFFKLMDFLKPEPGEPVIVKNTRNAFTSTNLQEMLRGKGVERLVVTGISTEQCCETTTRVAADLGFDVDFVTEATRTFPITDEATGEVLSTEEIVRRTEMVLRGRFARIATVEGLVREVAEAAVSSHV